MVRTISHAYQIEFNSCGTLVRRRTSFSLGHGVLFGQSMEEKRNKNFATDFSPSAFCCYLSSFCRTIFPCFFLLNSPTLRCVCVFALRSLLTKSKLMDFRRVLSLLRRKSKKKKGKPKKLRIQTQSIRLLCLYPE